MHIRDGLSARLGNPTADNGYERRDGCQHAHRNYDNATARDDGVLGKVGNKRCGWNARRCKGSIVVMGEIAGCCHDEVGCIRRYRFYGTERLSAAHGLLKGVSHLWHRDRHSCWQHDG